MNQKIVFFGETHGFADDFSEIKRLINKFKPKIILWEQLQNIELLNKEKQLLFLNEKKEFSKLVKFKEVEKLIQFCLYNNIPIKGIDFNNFGYSEKLIKDIINQSEEIDENELNKNLIKRTYKHIEEIKKIKTSGLVILGAWHLKKGSKIRETFNKNKYILPINNKGEEITEPQDKITFGEIKQ